MATTTWSAAAAGNWNVAGNWSAGVPGAGDDAVFDATSVQNCTVDISPSINSITINSTYSGAFTLSGQTMTTAGAQNYSGTGTLNLGNGCTITGNANFKVGTAAGSVTGTSCAVDLQGTGDFENTGITLKTLKCGYSGKTTTYKGTAIVLKNSTTPLTIDTGTFTQSGGLMINIECTGDTSAYSFGAGSTWSGNGDISIYGNANNRAITLPAATIGGNFRLRPGGSYTGVSFTLTGAVSVGQIRLGVSTANASSTFDSGNFNITTTSIFLIENSIATMAWTMTLGSSTVNNAVRFGIDDSTGSSTINMNTATINLTGNVRFLGANCIVNPGTSIVTITNTSTVTCNGLTPFYDLTINAAAKTITLADTIRTSSGGDFTITAGTLNMATFDAIIGGNTAINGTSTLTASGSDLTFGGDVTFAAGCTLTINGTTTFTLNGTGAVLATNGKTMPQCTFNANTYIQDTCTITTVIYGTDGITLYFEAGQTFTLTNLAAANFSGAIGATNKLRSSATGTAFTLSIPNAATVTYMDVRDCTLAGGFAITADDGSTITQGGNTGWDFGAVLTAATSDGATIDMTGWSFGANPYPAPASTIEISADGGATWPVTPAYSAWANAAVSGVIAPALGPGTYAVRLTTSDNDPLTLLNAFVIAAPGGGLDGVQSKIAIGIGCAIGM